MLAPELQFSFKKLILNINSILIKQGFGVYFHSNSADKYVLNRFIKKSYKKSANPGYQIGSHLRFGKLFTFNYTDEDETNKIRTGI